MSAGILTAGIIFAVLGLALAVYFVHENKDSVALLSALSIFIVAAILYVVAVVF